jgi:hypothetical protein
MYITSFTGIPYQLFLLAYLSIIDLIWNHTFKVISKCKHKNLATSSSHTSQMSKLAWLYYTGGKV